MSEEVINNVIVEEPTAKKSKFKRLKKKKSLARRIIEYSLRGIFGAFAIFIIAGNIQGEVNKKNNYGQSIRFGVGSFVVLTNSMEPEIPVDSAIITYQKDVGEVYNIWKAGQVQDITFANVYVDIGYFEPDTQEFKAAYGGIRVTSNRIMTHRLREIHIREDVEYGKGRYIFVCSGINVAEDPNNYANKKGQYQVFTEKEYLGVVQISNQFLGKIFRFIVSPIGLIIILLIPAAYLIIVSSIDIYKAMKASENEEAVEGPKDGTLAKVTGKDRERLKKELLQEMIEKKKKEKENDQ